MHAMGIQLEPGDHVLYRSNGGGGFGNPLERDPTLVLDDLKNGWISQDKAEKVYGVVVTSESTASDVRIESTKTEKHRLSLSKQIIPRGYGTGEIHPLGEKLTIGS